jgi:hypothetical protein
MLLGLIYQLIRFIIDLVLIRTRSEVHLRAEVLALRHQLRALERKLGKPTWRPGLGTGHHVGTWRKCKMALHGAR